MEDRFHPVETDLVWHALDHVCGDLGRVALVGEAEPELIALHGTAVDGEVDGDAVLAIGPSMTLVKTTLTC